MAGSGNFYQWLMLLALVSVAALQLWVMLRESRAEVGVDEPVVASGRD